MKNVCVIGWPIKHSRSPIIHNFWIAHYGISGHYEKLAIEPDRLNHFLTTMSNQGYCGCNITIPHKQEAFRKVLVKDPLTQQIGAINTVYFEQGKQYGLNTDGYGFISNLVSSLPHWSIKGKTCLLLGAGGAARAILVALLSEAASKVVVVNRTLSRAQRLEEEFGKRVKAIGFEEINQHLEAVDLLVNTTSLGMEGQAGLQLEIGLLSKDCIVTDIVYTPLMTDLLINARKAGLQTVDGLGMLLHQAVPGFEKWFGVRPEVTEQLRQILINDMVER